MATYFHHQHHHHNNNHASDIIPQQADGGLQTLILMNPNFAGNYSESHAPPQPSNSSQTSNFMFHAPTLYHAPPNILPHLVGVPLHSSSADAYQQHYAAWSHLSHVAPERESPRAQQGLSLTLASSQNHSFSRAVAAQGEPDRLQPPPASEPNVVESPAATVASAGADVAATLMATPSKYLKAAQELLEEVVNVNVDRVKSESAKRIKSKGESPTAAADSVAGDGSKEERAAELTPADKQELQMKKAKLITLLDEEVGGPNSARTYTSLALKTISNQFRSLRVAITGQIRATNRALGEAEGEGGGGGSLRLKMLDHQMRQQRALHQLGMIQNNAWRPQRGLPEKAVSVLRAWLFEHFLHPYPKDSDKILLAKQTGLTRSQVSNWFINARVRLWKPMIEEMYAEEVKEHQQQSSPDEKPSKQDHQHDEGHNPRDDQAMEGENHSSSMVANPENPFALVDSDTQGSSIKKQRMNNNEFIHTTNNNNFPNVELYNNNGCKEEANHHHHHQNKYNGEKQEDCSMMQTSNNGFMGGLVSPYPMAEIGRFENTHFPANFSGNSNGVSLTLGLPHCESLSIQQGSNHQAFLQNNQDTIDQYRGRLEMNQMSGFGGVKPPNSSQNPYAAQLLHDFVA
ncbi:hypothetical protein V2J09_010129 [Rumex salicifolius]